MCVCVCVGVNTLGWRVFQFIFVIDFREGKGVGVLEGFHVGQEKRREEKRRRKNKE